jgi:hypothetical protein
MVTSPEIQALVNQIRDLTGILRQQFKTGSAPVSPLGGGPVLEPYTSRPFKELEEYKKLYEKLDKNTEALGKSTEINKKQTDALLDHAKKLEGFAAATTAIGNILSQVAKYGVTRPYELLGGQAGVTARAALERERDLGSNITSVAALLATMLPGGRFIAGGILGAGQLGLNQILGRAIGQRESLEAGGLQNVAQMTQAGVMPAREGELLRFGAARLNIGAGMAGAQSFEQARIAGSLIGLTAQQMIPLFSEALRVGGAKGLKEIDWDRVMSTAAAGIYGTAEQIAAGVAMGGRAGTGQSALEAAVRRTGLNMAEVGQGALMARTQTFLAGAGAGNRLFEMATRTEAARVAGIPAAMGMITQVAGGAAGVAEGNEAAEMMLFQQFRTANPGATYMDFVEARRNKETDPRWLRTIQVASGAFAAGGQRGRIMGGALLGTRPSFIPGISRMMDEAFTGRLGEMIKDPGIRAGLAPGLVSTIQSEFTQTVEGSAKFFDKFNELLTTTNQKLSDISKSSVPYVDFLIQQAEVMERLSKSAAGLVADRTILRGFHNEFVFTGG